MYKVFVNNRPLTISSHASESQKNIDYSSEADFEEAVHSLQTSYHSVNIFGEDTQKTWDRFQKYYTKIYAAGGLVVNSKNEILWIYRLEKWDLPKGKMEKKENKKETAVREVEEECGISGLKIIRELPTTYHMYFHKENILKITYWFEMSYAGDEKPIPQTEEDISRVCWFHPSEMSEPLENTYANICELITAYKNI